MPKTMLETRDDICRRLREAALDPRQWPASMLASHEADDWDLIAIAYWSMPPKSGST